MLLAQSTLPMFEKVRFMWPEVSLFVVACIVMVLGLSRALRVRRLTEGVCALGLIVAGVLAVYTPAGHGLMPGLLPYAKVLVAAVGLLLLLLASGTVDREEEGLIATGRLAFNPLRTNRAEFYSFFLFSLTGVMLCAAADDLVWLFLALELTSLPTYIMVTISQTGRRGSKSQEAGVKYFFLGALGAAVFLYGFALLYGGTGTTSLTGIRDALAAQAGAGGINAIAMAGLLLALIGVGFKIAAVPMHLYTPDVYEGAASPVSAFLAFVPKTAGFLAIILLCSAAGWTHERGGEAGSLPELVRLTLWVMAALTMTWGNVLAILQSNVKRMLAYSSIAHSGYMLVGVIAGPGDGRLFSNGLAAVLFYLLVYGVSNMGAFAVLACLERRAAATGEPVEIETVEDIRGLCRTHPALGWTMVLSALSLMGFPPLLGFFGKVPLFTSAIWSGEVFLVLVLGVNSAIGAYYYLRLVFLPYLDDPSEEARAARPAPYASRPAAAMASAAGVIVLVFAAQWLMGQSSRAARLGGAATGGPATGGPAAVGARPRGPGSGGAIIAPAAAPAHDAPVRSGH
jgi:NADH-quinone oxidoreductase subunit N